MSTPVSDLAWTPGMGRYWKRRAIDAEAQLARIRDRVDALVDAGWMSLEAATELRNVYDTDDNDKDTP